MSDAADAGVQAGFFIESVRLVAPRQLEVHFRDGTPVLCLTTWCAERLFRLQHWENNHAVYGKTDFEDRPNVLPEEIAPAWRSLGLVTLGRVILINHYNRHTLIGTERRREAALTAHGHDIAWAVECASVKQVQRRDGTKTFAHRWSTVVITLAGKVDRDAKIARRG